MAVLVDAETMDATGRKLAKQFVDDLDHYEGFIIVAFNKGTKECEIYANCRIHDYAIASVILSHEYNEAIS